MAIELVNVSSGYSTGVINDNFQRLEDYINTNLLNRDGVDTGEPNQMNVPLDMNSQPILNFNTDVTDGNSIVTISTGDQRYVNVTGDQLQGPLDMASNPITVRLPQQATEPARKGELDTETAARTTRDAQITQAYQNADANLQAQISGGTPLEASAFSVISWHDQSVSNSVTIPANKNAWSFGPSIQIDEGQSITISEGSHWTIANGDGSPIQLTYDGGVL